MDVHQASSVLDEMSFALSNEELMADNVMTVLPIELTNATGTYLQHLNEDCLLEIFSRDPLTPMDLCSLAETCKRFKQITQRMFSKGFAIKRDYGRIYMFSSKDHSKLECTFQDTERVLRNFGPHLSEVYLRGDLDLVNLIAKYCDDITLQRLEIHCLKSIEGDTQQLSSIFQRLLKLDIYNCNVPTEPWYMSCDSLIELEIAQCENGTELLRNTFPKLEQFRFHSIYPESNTEALSEFVTRHGCLKSIEIYEGAFDYCKLLHAISCSCNELVELTLQYVHVYVDISHLQSLTKLKILNIGYFYGHPRRHTTHCEEIDFSRAFKSLETMRLSFDGGPQVVLNQIFDVLSRLQGFRELELVNCDDLNNIPWTRLTQLRKVNLTDDFLKEHSYLLDVIRQLINLEALVVIFLGLLKREEFSKLLK